MDAASNAVIGERIVALRKARGLTQADLARALGIDHKQVISNLEKGERSLKATELTQLAELLHVSPLVVLGLEPIQETPFVLWRQPTSEKERLADEAAFLERCRRYAFVERLADMKPGAVSLQFACDPPRTSFEAASAWADQTRGALDLGSMPASALQSALEHQHGIKIFVTTLEGGSGATHRGEVGDAILVNRGEASGRRAFSIAHELFHLLTWESTVKGRKPGTTKADARLEKLAENFAAALLLPRDALETRMPPGRPSGWSVFRWVELAREFGVSVPALAWRLVNLGRLDAAQARAIIEDPARSGAGERATTDAEGPLPERYVTLAFKAYVDSEISIGKLAELLETSVGGLRKLLAGYGFDLDSDVWEAPAVPA